MVYVTKPHLKYTPDWHFISAGKPEPGLETLRAHCGLLCKSAKRWQKMKPDPLRKGRHFIPRRLNASFKSRRIRIRPGLQQGKTI